VYRLSLINDIPYLSPADRAQLMKENEESVAWFESYQSERTDDSHGASDQRRRYGFRWWKVNDLQDNEGYNALPMRALTEHLQDPEFWKGLGRAHAWQDTGAWLFHWHRFIDHIAFGKKVESFFSSL